MDTAFTSCPVCMMDSGGGLCSPECADAWDAIADGWESSDMRMFATSAGAFLIDLSALRMKRVALPDHPLPAMRIEGEWHEFAECDEPTVGRPFRVVWHWSNVNGTRIPSASRSTPVVYVATCVICGNRNLAEGVDGHACDFGSDDL